MQNINPINLYVQQILEEKIKDEVKLQPADHSEVASVMMLLNEGRKALGPTDVGVYIRIDRNLHAAFIEAIQKAEYALFNFIPQYHEIESAFYIAMERS